MTAERIPHLLCPACGAEMSSALGCSSCKTAAYAGGGYTGKGPYEPIAILTCESTISQEQMDDLRRSYRVGDDGVLLLDFHDANEASLMNRAVKLALTRLTR